MTHVKCFYSVLGGQIWSLGDFERIVISLTNHTQRAKHSSITEQSPSAMEGPCSFVCGIWESLLFTHGCSLQRPHCQGGGPWMLQSIRLLLLDHVVHGNRLGSGPQGIGQQFLGLGSALLCEPTYFYWIGVAVM